MKIIDYLEARLAERSTWAGLGAAFTAALTTLASAAPHNLVTFLTYGIAACGVIAVLVPSQGNGNG